MSAAAWFPERVPTARPFTFYDGKTPIGPIAIAPAGA